MSSIGRDSGTGAVQVLDWKEAVETVATVNIALTGEQTLNGLLTSTSRVGVVAQTDPTENGIYVSAAGIWTRSIDADTDSKVTNGMAFAVGDSGSTKAGAIFILTTPDPITLGVTGLTFSELTALPVHALGGVSHSPDTLANLNSKVSDATLVNSVVAPFIVDLTGDGKVIVEQIGGGATKRIEFSHDGVTGLIDCKTGVVKIPSGIDITLASDVIGLLIKGNVVQTLDLAQFQNSAAVVLAKVDKNGAMLAPSFSFTADIDTGIFLDGIGFFAVRTGGVIRCKWGGATLEMKTDIDMQDNDIRAGLAAGMKLGTATNQKIGKWGSTPIIQPINTTDLKDVLETTGSMASGGVTPLDLDGGKLTAGGGVDITLTSDLVGLLIKGNAAQAVNLIEVQDSAGVVLGFTAANGDVVIGADTGSGGAKLEVVGIPGAAVGGFASGAFHVRSPSALVNANAVITGHNSFGGNKQLWYLGSTASSNDNIALINRQTGSLSLITSGNSDVLLTPNGTGKVGIKVSPNQLLTIEGTMDLKEQVDANADTAAYGQLWVKTATPNRFMFTDDAGTDFEISQGAGIATTIKVNTAIQSFVSTTTLSDVTGLSVALEANKKYHVMVVLYTSVGVGGLKAALNGPAGFTSLHYIVRVDQQSNFESGLHTAYDSSTGVAVDDINTVEIHATIINGGTAGNIVVRAAQEISNVATSDILRDSLITVEEFA